MRFSLLSPFLIVISLLSPLIKAGGCRDYKDPNPFDSSNITHLLPSEMYNEWCLQTVVEDTGDDTHKVAWLDKEEYEKLIFNSTTGKYVGSGPTGTVRWLIFFIDHRSPVSNQIRPSLQKLAYDYKGEVKFGVVTNRIDEEISLAYDVTRWPRGFLIDIDGTAYGFNMWKPDILETKKWIDEKLYRESPLRFKA
jgi:hypothetical protein